jgi:hypothetical protein
MRRDLGRSGGAMGEDDQGNQVRRLETDPTGKDRFEWPPKDPERTLGGLADSTTADKNVFADQGASTVVDQASLPGAAAVERILERQNPASLEKLQQSRADTLVLQPSPQVHAVTRTAPVVQEWANPEMGPTAPRRRFGVASVLVGLALIAIVEGVFIVWTMRRPTGSREVAVKPVPQNEAGKAAVRSPQHAPVDRVTDLRAVPGSPVGTSHRSQNPALPGKNAALPAKRGRLVIRSEPSGAEVSIDGRKYGVTPMTREDVAPGEHAVVLTYDGAEIRQTVRVEPGSTFSMIASMKAVTPASGWVAIKSPVQVSVFEDGALVGTSLNPKILLTEGAHTLELINEDLGFREERSVRVEAGKIISVGVTLSQTTINFNARPWAEVWIDGKSIGETPIGNFPITIGPHEVTFRHPELGEKAASISVKAGTPVRVTADLTSLRVEVR